MKPALPRKTFERLNRYRHVLRNLLPEGNRGIFSHELAQLAGVTAAQVRRDLMVTQVSGSPTKGYELQATIDAIGNLIDARQGEAAALVGIGNLGRAILAFFQGRNPKLSIVAAFDWDPQKVNRVYNGCLCYPMGELSHTIRRAGIRVALITVPASEAQKVADSLIAAGIRGLLNFAPIRLQVPPSVYVQDLDFGMSLEEVAYYARRRSNDEADEPVGSKPTRGTKR